MNTKSNSIFQFRNSIKQFVLIAAFLLRAISYVPAQNSKNTEKFDGYLFAYFEGTGKAREQEQIRFAVSENAVNWFALNQNQPVLRSELISQTGGVRDPHILPPFFHHKWIQVKKIIVFRVGSTAKIASVYFRSAKYKNFTLLINF